MAEISRVKLGVNIDHIATIRQARRTYEPDPVWAAAAAQLGGADAITIHLREDRRHIQDRDLHLLRQVVTVKLNLEAAAVDEIISIALKEKPEQVTLVPERRQEITTEGGLDVHSNLKNLAGIVHRLHDGGIQVSMFIDPEEKQTVAAKESGADSVEFHTGNYANAKGKSARQEELTRLVRAAKAAEGMGLEVFAGHGLTYDNVEPIVSIPQIRELNIGHTIISRAIFVGLQEAVRQMRALLRRR